MNIQNVWRKHHFPPTLPRVFVRSENGPLFALFGPRSVIGFARKRRFTSGTNRIRATYRCEWFGTRITYERYIRFGTDASQTHTISIGRKLSAVDYRVDVRLPDRSITSRDDGDGESSDKYPKKPR